MCKVLQVSRSGYYDWLKIKEELRIKSDSFEAQVLTVFNDSNSTYGSPRIAIQLSKDLGRDISKTTVARTMKSIGIIARRKKRFKNTTDSNHNLPIAPNLLNRDFEAKELATKWVGDITYIRMNSKWLYLTTVIDLADRMVVGWALSNNMTAKDTVIKAFNNAANYRTPKKGLIFHSDRGVQYASDDFRQLLNQYKTTQSMSRKGNCWDNAVAESFFKTIKVECLYNHTIIAQTQAYRILFNYIDGWYNTLRIHSSLKGPSPLGLRNQKLFYIAA
jgi:transposase InsO family protein